MKDEVKYTYLMINIDDINNVNNILNNIYKSGLLVVHHECDTLTENEIKRKYPKLNGKFTGSNVLKLLIYDKNKSAINNSKNVLNDNNHIYISDNKEEAKEDIITFLRGNLFEVFDDIEFFSSYEYLFNKNNISRKYIDNQEIDLILTSCNVYSKMR